MRVFVNTWLLTMMILVSHYYYRHKTNLRVLREMLPEDLLSYCQHHGLLDSILEEKGMDEDDDDEAHSSSPDFMVPPVARMPSPQESV